MKRLEQTLLAVGHTTYTYIVRTVLQTSSSSVDRARMVFELRFNITSTHIFRTLDFFLYFSFKFNTHVFKK